MLKAIQLIDSQIAKQKLFFSLNIISELLGYLRFYYIDYFGFISMAKFIIDLPKEMLRYNLF